jgi:hypothetical protein
MGGAVFVMVKTFLHRVFPVLCFPSLLVWKSSATSVLWCLIWLLHVPLCSAGVEHPAGVEAGHTYTSTAGPGAV